MQYAESVKQSATQLWSETGDRVAEGQEFPVAFGNALQKVMNYLTAADAEDLGVDQGDLVSDVVREALQFMRAEAREV